MDKIRNRLVTIFIKDLNYEKFVSSVVCNEHINEMANIDIRLNNLELGPYKKSLISYNHSEPTHEHVMHGDIVVINYLDQESGKSLMGLVHFPAAYDDKQFEIIKSCIDSFEGVEVHALGLNQAGFFDNFELDNFVQDTSRFKPKTLQMVDDKQEK